MKKGILLLIVLAASLLLLCNTLTVSAGVEPSPLQPEINKLHSVERNISTIDKRIGKLLDSPASPKGVTNQLEAMANKLGDLDTRLADVLNVLPTSSIPPYDGQDEVLSALEGIRSDSGSIVDLATRMGVEPSPWQPAALSVKNNAQTIINTIDGYTCPIGRDCTPSSEPCTTFNDSLNAANSNDYYPLGSVSEAVITGELSCPSNPGFDLYLQAQNSKGLWIPVASSLGVTCTESVSYDVRLGSYNGRPFRWRVSRYVGHGDGTYSLLSCIYR